MSAIQPATLNDATLAWFTAFTRFVIENPQIAANYGTLVSSLTALVVAMIALYQARTSRKALDVTRLSLETSQEQAGITRASLETSREQARIASSSLNASLNQARRDRINQQAPLIAVVPLPGIAHVFAERGITRDSSPSQQFDLLRESFDWSQTLEVDRHGLDYPRLDSVWLSGRVLLRNEGTTSAIIQPFSWVWEVIEGPSPTELTEHFSFLLEPGERIVLRWFHTYSVHAWMRMAAAACRDKTDFASEPEYNFKYLGVDEESHYLTVSSASVPDLADHFTATFHFLPLRDSRYAEREDTSTYSMETDSAYVGVHSRTRSYPDRDRDTEN